MSQLGSIGTLSVDIVTRLDRLNSQFKEAEQQASKAGKRIEKAVTAGGLSGITQTALKAFATFSLVEGGVKAVTVATEALSGNFEKAGELVKQLPLGIGPLAAGIEGLILSTTSWGKSITKAKDELAKTEVLVNKLAQANEVRIQRVISAEKALKRARKEGQLIGVSEFEAEIVNLNQSSQERIQELQKQLKTSKTRRERTRLVNALSQETLNTSRKRAQLAGRIAESGGDTVTSPTFGRRIGRFESTANIGQAVPTDPLALDKERNRLLNLLIGTTKIAGSLN